MSLLCMWGVYTLCEGRKFHFEIVPWWTEVAVQERREGGTGREGEGGWEN